MKHRILYILTALVLFAGCEDSVEFDPEHYYPSLYQIGIGQNEVVFSPSASSVDVSVLTNSATWTASDDTEWISVAKADNGEYITISVTDNDTPEARQGYIAISQDGQTIASIKVVQELAYAEVQPDELSFSTYSGTQNVMVTSNCTWTCSSDCGWITAERHNHDYYLVVTVAENSTAAARTGSVGIYIGNLLLATINVTQEKPYAYAEADVITFRGMESAKNVKIISNCDWTCSSESSWLYANKNSSGDSINLSVSENTTGASRTATVGIYMNDLQCSSITVTQKAADISLVTSSSEAANCYIVSKAGGYMFPPVKGNSGNSVGTVSSVEVLWESFGTSVKPEVGDLIESVDFVNGYICFSTPSTFKEGNAVIAAKDASGNILWSWHIWLTDQPQGQVYYNNAGTMMDRNLGATSATPGDVGALGLLYQWGRKDPFLGASAITYESPVAESTIEWPSVVYPDWMTGTIEYTVSHPTTFIESDRTNYDWHYTASSNPDITRWPTSGSDKSVYDPCPSGWRVPDGGKNGVWAKASGSTSSIRYTFDSANYGVNFSQILGSGSSIWYPAAGLRADYYYSTSWDSGDLINAGLAGEYWSASHDDLAYGSNYIFAAVFDFGKYKTTVDLSSCDSHAYGHSVRCIKE